MIELTRRAWISIAGRGRFTIIDPDQLGERIIRIGDHVLIDGSERVVVAIEFLDRRARGRADVGLLVRDPDEV